MQLWSVAEFATGATVASRDKLEAQFFALVAGLSHQYRWSALMD
jgi:hypothetical protein